MIGHRLSHILAEGTDMDTTAGTELIEWVKSEIFQRNIASFAGDKEDEALDAKKHTDRGDEISFWTEGLKLDLGHTEAKVAWCDPEWRMRATYLGFNKEVFDAELQTIGEALEIALKNRPPGFETSSQLLGTRFTRSISRQTLKQPSRGYSIRTPAQDSAEPDVSS